MNDNGSEGFGFTTRWRRTAGVAGLCGALLFFAGDMLFYGHPGSGADFHQGLISTVRQASLARLYAGGLVGPVAAVLCILGFWHVFLNVSPAHPRSARVLFGAFCILMISGSAIHALWTAKGLALKYCYGSNGAECQGIVQAVSQYWNLAYYLGAAPAWFAFGFLLLLVLVGRTLYPRWMVLSNPAVVMLFSPLAERAPQPFGAILVGGFTNLSIALFFAVSILATWRGAKETGVSRGDLLKR